MVSFKKLFGFVFLLTAVLFMSCDLGFSDKKGSVSFEIPFADIVALKNEVSSESENDNETYKTYYTAFVQLKGNGGYYVPKVETVEENQRGNLSFDFYELPEKQTYTIMVDIFSETRYGSHPAGHKLLAYSGQVSDIRVKAGEQKTVDLFAEHPEETASLFDIKVDYLDGDEEKTKTIIVNYPYLDSDDAADSELYIGYCEADKKYYYRETEPTVYDPYNSGYSRECKDQERSEWLELKDFSYVLKADSHFEGFTFITHKDIYGDDNEYERQDIQLDFSKGAVSVTEYMDASGIFNYPADITKVVDNATVSFSSWLPQVSFYSIEFKAESIQEPGDDPDPIDDPEPEPVIVDETEGAILLTVTVEGINASRSITAESDTQTYFSVLAQIKSASGTYAAKMNVVQLDNNLTNLGESLTFSFDKLAVDTTYKIMVDILSETRYGDQSSGHKLLAFTGEKSAIQLEGGKTTNVTVDATHSTDVTSLFDIKLDYLDGDSTASKTIKVNDPYLDSDDATDSEFYIGYCEADKKYYYRETKPTVYDPYNFGYSRECKDQERSEWKELTDFSYVLKTGSHFDGFTFTAKKSDPNDYNTLIEAPLDFSKGACSVSKYMGESNIFNYPAEITKEIGTLDFNFSSWLPQVSFYSIEFKVESIQEPEDDPTTQFTETTSGTISIESEATGSDSSIKALSFNKRAKTNRYISAVDLSEVLGQKTLSDGDTVVFILKTPGLADDGLGFSQFYYQLHEDDWADLSDDELYAGNNCINCNFSAMNGEYTFVMPLNFIQSPQEFNTLLLYFDLSNTTASDISLTVSSIDYYIFPANTKTFVFGVGQNWDSKTNNSKPYRYEFTSPLADSRGVMYTLLGGETVNVTISGTVLSYRASGSEILSQAFSYSQNFNAEIYDGAPYKVDSSFEGCSEYFHPLSDNSKNNNKTIQVQNGSFLENGTFSFSSIRKPCYDIADDVDEEELTAHNYRFQLETPCYCPSKLSSSGKSNCDPSVLLIIQDFEMTTNIIPAQ